MWTANRFLVLVALCFGWCLRDAAAVLQLLQLGTGTAATYAVSASSTGAALASGLGGAFALGTLSGALGSRKGIFRRRTRYGRSSPVAPSTELGLYSKFAVDLVEKLDTSGCAKRLLCEQAFLESQGPIEQRADEKDVGGDNPESENGGEEGSVSVDEAGEMILNFVKTIPSEAFEGGRATDSLLEAVAVGEGEGNCTEVFLRCPYPRGLTLSLMIKEKIL